MMASNCVGHVVVQPLKAKATHSPRLFMILRTVRLGSAAKPALDVKRPRARIGR